MIKPGNFWILFSVLICVRLLAMALVPLMDTTEARYGAIAQLMVKSNDWITPWFEPGVPFWGKPPLSFWAQAISFKYLGQNEFALRLPALVATLMSIRLFYTLASHWFNRNVARLSALIYMSSSLGFIAAGTVMTDPFLSLGCAIALVSFAMSRDNNQWYWKYGLFIGISVGLLAKGPLALVLIGSPIVIWLFYSEKTRAAFTKLPWLSGTVLLMILVLPWYIAAEVKTHGFLEYFILGEHLKRFIEPGWGGDLYGSAHLEPKGMIWLMLLYSTLPWVLIVPYIVFLYWRQKTSAIVGFMNDEKIVYLIAMSLIAPVFFTMASNILATYLLPSLSAMSLLLALSMMSIKTHD